MIKIESLVTPSPEQWTATIMGMRNPMNSWDRMDSFTDKYGRHGREFVLGEKDLELARRLYLGGSEHRKYLRMLPIYVTVTAPLYWWKEADTYGVGKVQNSCSTMHKIHAKEFTLEDFSTEHLNTGNKMLLGTICGVLNDNRKIYLETRNKADWWQMIQLLPSSYNQKRTVCLNYEVLVAMIRQRTGHKLDEWNDFIEYLLQNVPYLKEITNL